MSTRYKGAGRYYIITSSRLPLRYTLEAVSVQKCCYDHATIRQYAIVDETRQNIYLFTFFLYIAESTGDELSVFLLLYVCNRQPNNKISKSA